MATTYLRLKGITPAHAVSALIAALPIGWVAWKAGVSHAVVPGSLAAMCAAAAFVPWLSWLIRRAYRAKCDDIAVHVRNESLPYKTITEVIVERTARRKILRLKRGESIELELILWDAFAGTLQPIDVLAKKLAEHGKPIPDL
jgi:hypothetical protein